VLRMGSLENLGSASSLRSESFTVTTPASPEGTAASSDGVSPASDFVLAPPVPCIPPVVTTHVVQSPRLGAVEPACDPQAAIDPSASHPRPYETRIISSLRYGNNGGQPS